ncbi:WecB/TagA/CpsF family glycosyltransferase [Mitsuaria sp. WAJ17]|uniref:WecB/TagA/CpsF family glycosyltransferase n=1 Tax=Mitsuaria sp. WAJ17 TaxID=2761452 RepID=UPI001602880E|nr:WecB/TagA/CpsF family glycosyltransferase [Mitsuaria sp. WAJ17]MBB2487047.1 WecB/TagA/CpsF family glycosyltransferase [Mitsuaria sp. WAJ17]
MEANHPSRTPRPAALSTPGLEARLRAFDLALAVLAMVPLGLPLLLSWKLGLWEREATVGRQGHCFYRYGLRLSGGFWGRFARRLGAAHWPSVWNVLLGDLSWVGPRPLPVDEQTLPMAPPVRPGLVNRWQICRRAAIDFSDESSLDQADWQQRSLRRHAGLLIRAVLVRLLPPRASRFPDLLQVADVAIHNLSMHEALTRIEQLMDSGRGELVCFANAACVNTAARDRGYRRALRRAALVLPDGIGIKIAGQLLGTPLKQNVNGTDLYPRLMARLNHRHARLYLLGGAPGIAQQVAGDLEDRWPGLQVVGARDGYFTAADEGAVAADICASGAELLLVARGVPLQETFVDRYGTLLGVRVALGVGGLFDFVSGRIPRAPEWLRELGCEWLYRLWQEPGRMWRRYLVGNLTFLGRVLAQALGWRRAQIDDPAPLSSTAGSAGLVRAVLFATPLAAPDLPLSGPTPTALLPVGHATLIERQIELLARANVKYIDVVACDSPEALRARLGEGARWGVQIRMHVVKDPQQPYGVLSQAALQETHRVLIGHCDSWIDAHSLERLLESDRVAVLVNQAHSTRWSGWASGPGATRLGCESHWTREDLARHLERQTARRLRLNPQLVISRLDGLGLLQLQSLASQGRPHLGVPASWRAMPWGAMHPSAHVHDSARIEGPVLVGPGCLVEAGAVLGPRTYLFEDVVVSEGSTVRQSLILAGTYVGRSLDLEWSVVRGNQLRHIGLRIRTVLATQDALLMPLAPAQPPAGSSPSGRVLAGVMAALSAPVALPALLGHALVRRQAPWTRQTVVLEPANVRGKPRSTVLRLPRQRASLPARLLCHWIGLLEVMRGHRAWFGARPRQAATWCAIDPAWQRTLSELPIGLLHAPAWFEDPACRSEAEAAADIYCAHQSHWLARLQILCSQGQVPPRPQDRRSGLSTS